VIVEDCELKYRCLHLGGIMMSKRVVGIVMLIAGIVMLYLRTLDLYRYNLYKEAIGIRIAEMKQTLDDLPPYKIGGVNININSIKDEIIISTIKKMLEDFPQYGANIRQTIRDDLPEYVWKIRETLQEDITEFYRVEKIPTIGAIPVILLAGGAILLIHVFIPNKFLSELGKKLQKLNLRLEREREKRRIKKEEEEKEKKRPLLSRGEVIIKNYHCSKMINPRCNGYLSVTNRRVVFHGYAKHSCIVQEFKVGNVAGISAFYGRVYLKLVVVIAIGALLYAGYCFFFATNSGIVEFLSLIIQANLTWMIRYKIDVIGMVILAGVLLYFFSWRPTFVLKIYSSQATSAPITLGEGYGTPWGSRALQTLTGYPTAETGQMIRELGILVQDIQTYHDKAIDMWRYK
jgi:hypothetical protein